MKISMISVSKRIRSRHFKTSFGMLLLLLHLLLGIGLFLWHNSFYTTTGEKIDFRLQALLSEVEQSMSQAKDNALFIGALPSVHRAFLSTPISVEQLFAVSKDLKPFVNQMSYDSLTLYFQNSNAVYDTKAGFYVVDSFYNQDLLKRFQKRHQGEYWEFGYPYHYYYDNAGENHVLTYVHTLPIYGIECYGFIAVNIPLAQIQHLLMNYQAECGEEIRLFFEDKLLGQSVRQTKSNVELKPFLKETSTTIPGLRTEVLVPPHFFLSRMTAYLPILIVFYLLLLAGNFVGALFYTCYHLNKLDLFFQKIGMSGFRSLPSLDKSKPLSSLGQKPKILSFPRETVADEFQLLNEAANHLQSQINNIRQTVAESKILLQERLLTDILYHHIELDKIPPEYGDYDISFPFPYYCIVLMAIQEIESVATTTIKEEIKLVAKQNATRLFLTLGKVYSIYSEKENLLFLINTSEMESLKSKLESIAKALKKGMKESLGFHLLFSVAICDVDNPVPYYAWTKARKNLIFTSGSSDSFIIFGKQENYATALMPSVVYQMTRAIIDKDLPRLQGIVEHFFAHNLPDDMPIEKGRKTLLLAGASVFSSLLEMDVLFPIDEMNQMVRKIEQSESLSQSKDLFRSFLAGLIHTENKVSAEAQVYIQQTIIYLEKHFAEPMTIPQIAENVNISPIYLNKLFKLYTGKTLSEYLNFYRMEKSKKMLLETDMTINDISKVLGYNDVRSYIRYFKKFYDVTPNSFRKSGEE